MMGRLAALFLLRTLSLIQTAEILFGEGTTVETRSKLDAVVLVLGALLACSLTLIAILAFYVNRGVCRHCKVATCTTRNPRANEAAVDESTDLDGDEEARSTKCTPYFAQFGRHSRVPGVINATLNDRDDTSVLVPADEAEQQLEAKAATVADLHSKIYQNIKIVQQRQKISYEKHKGKNVKSSLINVGDEVLRANKRKEGRKGGKLECNSFGPYVVSSITNKGVATLLSSTGAQLRQSVNVSQLKPFIRPMLRAEPKLDSEGSVADHQYALSGAKYAKDLHPIQDKLLSYVLDHNRPGAEVIVKEGDVCLTREDFWSLGLPQCMESNIGNTCLKMVQEATQRHGKDIYIVDMYVVPTWKSKTADALTSFPADQLATKDMVFIPAWSRQQGKADHYLLCVIKPAKRELYLLDPLKPDGFGDNSYKDIFSMHSTSAQMLHFGLPSGT
ncbi:hypothetical protein CgunFtcFv8_017357 [Champsocephalus gunnari]|uniref:Ubiquitin-like protease family profile domain-containing protein n=1 Tax=Champsocephalus gunnari TaxID=52237 RepID=A0AAN8HR34_CHAGU|nr:hypothetical protein CgunFtcFv8_017357 [Champsocephalus gunnari]